MLSKQASIKFIDKHKLDQKYLDKATKYYEPMADSFIANKPSNQPVIIGVNGCQGSGKSTLSDFIGTYIEDQSDYKTVVFSLDDFYYTREIRQQLSKDIHPLLATRGVPGTHNATLLQYVVNQLKYQQPVYIPQFNKALDDVEPKENWLEITEPVDFIIIEGWCLGVPAQSDAELVTPINDLEKTEDAAGVWRHYVNESIKKDYQPIYDFIDHWVVLKAPKFDTVYTWRKEQEDKLKEKLKNATAEEKSNLMSDEQVLRFIQFFERLTVHGFETLPNISQFCFELDNEREISMKTEVLEEAGNEAF